jgi:hypothetical protein
LGVTRSPVPKSASTPIERKGAKARQVSTRARGLLVGSESGIVGSPFAYDER